MIPWRSGSRTGLVMMSVPVAVIVSSYLWLVVDHQQLGLWNVVVHESGQYSLGQTVWFAESA